MERATLYGIIAVLLGYEVFTAIQHKGNTISEIVWGWPWQARMLLCILAAHLSIPGGIIENILKRLPK